MYRCWMMDYLYFLFKHLSKQLFYPESSLSKASTSTEYSIIERSHENCIMRVLLLRLILPEIDHKLTTMINCFSFLFFTMYLQSTTGWCPKYVILSFHLQPLILSYRFWFRSNMLFISSVWLIFINGMNIVLHLSVSLF